jgi:predicted negative regulator of RcsB-dependent stress response
VSVHLTEEEQIEIFKRWWKDYGTVIVSGILAAVVAYFAWTYWSEKQHAKAENASAQYDTMVKLLSVQAGKVISDGDKSTAEHIAEELKANNTSSLYAQSSAFFLAKLAVDAGNLDKAVEELKWVLQSKPEVAVAQLAHARLARVYLARAAYAEAEAQLTEEPGKAFTAEFAEIHGDIFKAQGNKAAALTAYQKALDATDASLQERAMLLKLKINELMPAPVVAEEKAQ